MCLLALFFRVVADAPLIVGANREERYARPGEPPARRPGPVPFVAGLDPVAGGTWLGINQQGLLVAVTNRPKSHLPEQSRSRGLLARDLLACPTAKAAAAWAAAELARDRYAGCNVLCADPADAVVLHGGDWLRVRPLPPGIHLLTNHDVNDVTDRRLAHALGWLSQRHYQRAVDCVSALQQLCAQAEGEVAICLHGQDGGTVSSSILALRTCLPRSLYLHAQGPPDRTPYVDCSPLLRDLFAGG